MSDHKPSPMTVEEFLTWAEFQPGRHELVDGRVVAMAPQRVRQAELKFSAQVALLRAVRDAGMPCQVLPDGVTIRVDRTTAFEPDAVLRCGAPLDGTMIEVPDPLLVVEVLSPSTRGNDMGAKLTGYFRVSGLRHYLIIDGDRAMVTHHRRSDDDTIETRLVGFGSILLDPPGIEISIEALLGGSTA